MKIKTHVLGLPIIGQNRELKFFLEKYIRKEIDKKKIININNKIIKKNIKIQEKYCDIITLGYHFYFDRMIYTMCILGFLPNRFKNTKTIGIKEMLYLFKGYKKKQPLKMLKWFGTNYHYFEPEIDKNYKKKYEFKLFDKELNCYKGFKKQKISLIGPLTFIELSNFKIKKKKAVKEIFLRYKLLINKFKNIKFIQIEEPIVNKFNYNNIKKYKKSNNKLYSLIKKNKKQVWFISYFNKLDNKIIKFLKKVNVFHFDFLKAKIKYLKKINKKIILSLGLVKGDNIWICNYKNILKKISKTKKKFIYISSTCSFLHIPINFKKEIKNKIFKFFSFTYQKLNEIYNIKNNLNKLNSNIIKKNNKLNTELKKIKYNNFKANFIKKIKKLSNYNRKKIKIKHIGLKYIPLTTIGSFPQTRKIRKIRKLYFLKKINFKLYRKYIKKIIYTNIKIQKKIGLDVIVNGEPERSDMVDFFFKNYTGCLITNNGWVQSYGTRCVKPPIIYGLIKRKKSNIKKWYKKNSKNNLKGILTGPVTMLKWSFCRENINKLKQCLQISKAISKDIKDFYILGYKIIQIDEPALKEFMYKLKDKYKKIIVYSFNYSCRYIFKKKIQIHTHICYSDIKNSDLNYLKKMFVDVISIESSKNIKKTVKTIKHNNILKTVEFGIGIYNVHSPFVPSVNYFYNKINYIIKNINYKKIWINPDCGLKTRRYKEILQALINIKLAILKIKTRIPNIN
ncbi:5-methyltetrahydropteroyltriglutamate--homocysteine S-methyltransferase [Candidatus Vidania fulgoroideorum]